MIKKYLNYLFSALKYFFAILCVCLVVFSPANVARYYGPSHAYSIKDFFENLFSKPSQAQTLDTVYLGGMALGFTLQCKGAIVIAVGQVHTAEGVKNTIIDGKIEPGDIVNKIDETLITSAQTISDKLLDQNQNNHPVRLEIIRNSATTYATILPAKDIISGEYKLGLWIRDNSAGVGTLTFVREKDNRFASLGHSVCDIDTGTRLPLDSGSAFHCNIIGVQPSKKGEAGELKGLFLKSGSVIGSLDKNNEYGVYGYASPEYVKTLTKKVKVASRAMVQTGRASIFCTLDGTNVEEFSVEIIKTNRQNKQASKSMIIRITDEDLIKRTGGIVQGMSGSPIVQNGMLVGAITHVFVSDPTKGYGVYAEWMLQN